MYVRSNLTVTELINISSGKVFTYEHHIRKCSHMNIIYGFFWKLHFSKNVRIWSYTVRHMIIELNHMWDSYTTSDYLHIPNPKMFTCEIIYQHHIPKFIYQLHMPTSYTELHIPTSHMKISQITCEVTYSSENCCIWWSHMMFTCDHHIP